MIVYDDIEQNSDEWLRLRMGIPTASEFATVMAKNRSGTGPGLTRQTYMRKLAGERLTGNPSENYSNAYMDRGHEQEDDARRLYAFQFGVEPILVGFISSDDGTRGASPDSLIGEDGLLEIKTKSAHLLIECIEKVAARKNSAPPEHIAQCQGQIWIAERKWCDLALYCPGLPLVTYRIERDDEYISNLASEVQSFNDELAAMVKMVEAYGT